jgi:hypothetical protein
VLLLWDRTGTRRWLRRYAVAGGIWLAITISAFVVNGRLVEKKVYPWQTAAAPLDIIGTLRYSPRIDNDWLLRKTEGVPWAHTDKIQKRARIWYRPEASFLDITQGEGALFEYPSTDTHRQAIAAAWRLLVFAHPIAFLRHRVGVARATLDTRAEVWFGFANADWGEDLLHHRATHSKIQLAWVQVMSKVAPTDMFHVALYFVLALVLLPMSRRQPIALVLLLSAVLHEVGLFMVAPAIDYRYSHWMVLCTMIGAVILFVTRRRARASDASHPRATSPTPP